MRHLRPVRSLLLFVFVCIAAYSNSSGAAGDAPKAKVPVGAARQAAIRAMKAAYADEFAKPRPDRVRLIRAGKDEQKNLDVRWALLTTALDMAVESGKLIFAMDAIDLLEASHQIDGPKEKADAAAAIAKRVQDNGARYAFIIEAEKLIGQAVAAEGYEPAMRVVDLALPMARAKQDLETLKRLTAKRAAIKDATAAYDAAHLAEIKLIRTPEDPGSKLALGRYRCLYRDDWRGGLPLLAQGNDPALAELARADAEGGTTAEGYIAVAEKFWTAADTYANAARVNTKHRAKYWYEKAASALKSGPRLKYVQGRILEVEGMPRDPLGI